MDKNNTKIKYVGYARKSTEDTGRQVQSIDDQLEFTKKKVKDEHLEIIGTPYSESKSAKAPDVRTAFYKMLEKIESGEANGIIAWKLDRLSRNPVDTARVQWLLQKGIIKSIITSDREYLPEHSGLLFSVETGMANQTVLDLSKNVKRGLSSKVSKGHPPINAPLGYLNTKNLGKGENYIIPDPERFDLVRKMWDLMLTARYTVPQILKIVNEDWGFKTKKTKKQGGKELSRSALYRIFSDIFFTGTHYYYKGVPYSNGQHKPMITLQEFDRVQEILGRKGKPRLKEHRFSFTGAIHCNECGCSITAEVQKGITYYHCTGRRKDYKCSQRKYIRVEELELQIKIEVDKITIIPKFRDWALERLREFHKKEGQDQENIYETQHKTMLSCQKQLNKLLDMRLQDQVTEEEYNTKRNILLGQIDDLEEKLKNTQQRVKDWLKTAERVINFATYAHGNFIKGDYEVKKKILLGLGSNFILKDGKLKIEDAEWLIPIKENYKVLETEYLKFELDETLSQKEKEGALVPLRSTWRRERDSNPRYP